MTNTTKRLMLTLTLVLTLGATLVPSQAPPETIDNPRYWAMKDKLDEGGIFYGYFDVKDLLRNFVANLQEQSAPPFDQGLGGALSDAYSPTADRVIDRLGVYGVHDIGLSTIKEDGVFLNRVFISAPEGRTGLLKLFGEAPHAFETLEYAPADTLAFHTADFDVTEFWTLVQQIALDVSGPQGQAGVNMIAMQSQMVLGMEFNQFLASLGGEFCLIVGVDSTRQITVPIQGQMQSFTMPQVAILIRTNNDTLYQTFQRMLTMQGMAGAEITDEDGLRRLPLMLPNPLGLTPALAQNDRYFILTLNADYLDALMDARKKGGPLRGTEEFKSLSKGLPAEGNAMGFVSSKLGAEFEGVFEAMAKPADPEQAMLFEAFVKGMRKKNVAQYKVLRAEADGLAGVMRTPAWSHQYLAGAAIVAPTALIAAISAPAFLGAQTKAKAARVRAGQRELQTAPDTCQIDEMQMSLIEAPVE